MSSRREVITAALAALLVTPPAGVTKPAGLAVHRMSMLPIEEDALPALVVYWTDFQPERPGEFISYPDHDRLLTYLLSVRVECRSEGEPIDQKLDPLLQYVRQVIHADPSLGGLALAVREDGIKVDGVARDRILGGAAADYVFRMVDVPLATDEPTLGGNLVRASYPTHPTEMTLEVVEP